MADRDPNDPADDECPGGGAAAAGAAKAPKPIVIDRYKFKQDVVGYLTRRRTRLYLFDVATKKAEALTEPALEAAAPSWSRGREVDCVHRAIGQGCGALQHEQRVRDGSARGATPRQVTQYDGVRGWLARPAGVEPDGSKLVYLQSHGRQAERVQHDAARRGAGGGRRAEDSGGGAGSRRLGAALHAGRSVDSLPGGGRPLGISGADCRPMAASCSA